MNTTSKTKRKPLPPHWYAYYYGECPVCGRDKSYKERRYSKKPKYLHQRIIFLSDQACYDGCIG